MPDVRTPPILSIGVLAHNEEHRIGAMLQSLLAQDIFGKFVTEIVVVANGCTDKTAEVARETLENGKSRAQAGSARVEVLHAAGKANAWNEFVQRLSSGEATILILMDADIWFLSSDTLSKMVATLEVTPGAVVCVDRPIKDIELKTSRTLFQRLLSSATTEIDVDNVPLCGQLYCARSDALRLIRVPPEIQVEDGFIRALLLTRGFCSPEDRSRIVLASEAAHGFASVKSFAELVKHERWIVAGSIVNMLLFRRFGAQARSGCDAMALMRTWDERNPEWLPAYVEAEARALGWRLLPSHWWTRRWTHLWRVPFPRRFFRIPVAVIGAILDGIIFFSAIRRVRLGRGYRYWRRA